MRRGKSLVWSTLIFMAVTVYPHLARLVNLILVGPPALLPLLTDTDNILTQIKKHSSIFCLGCLRMFRTNTVNPSSMCCWWCVFRAGLHQRGRQRCHEGKPSTSQVSADGAQAKPQEVHDAAGLHRVQARRADAQPNTASSGTGLCCRSHLQLLIHCKFVL